jgi:hypothetical protein
MIPVPEPFIVAEISKNWRNGESVAPTPILAIQFEILINNNLVRGYVLHTFQLHRMMVEPDQLNETIIAVFRHVGFHDVAH